MPADFRIFTVAFTASFFRRGGELPVSQKMFEAKTIQRERSRAVDYHYQRQRDRQEMVFNPVSFLGSEPVQKEAESPMNSCNSSHHRERDDQGGNSAK